MVLGQDIQLFWIHLYIRLSWPVQYIFLSSQRLKHNVGPISVYYLDDVQFSLETSSPSVLTLLPRGVWWRSVLVKQILDLKATRDNSAYAGKMI